MNCLFKGILSLSAMIFIDWEGLSVDVGAVIVMCLLFVFSIWTVGASRAIAGRTIGAALPARFLSLTAFFLDSGCGSN